MAVRISQADVPEANRTTLRVQGSLTREGAHWLERKCSCLLHRAGLEIVIDLTEVTFLDEAGAVAMRRLRQYPSVSVVGCQLYTRQVIEAVDLALRRQGVASREPGREGRSPRQVDRRRGPVSRDAGVVETRAKKEGLMTHARE